MNRFFCMCHFFFFFLELLFVFNMRICICSSAYKHPPRLLYIQHTPFTSNGVFSTSMYYYYYIINILLYVLVLFYLQIHMSGIGIHFSVILPFIHFKYCINNFICLSIHKYTRRVEGLNNIIIRRLHSRSR